MDPNANQPNPNEPAQGQPPQFQQPPQPAASPDPYATPPASGSDWQQGLGMNAQMPSTQPGVPVVPGNAPTPMAPNPMPMMPGANPGGPVMGMSSMPSTKKKSRLMLVIIIVIVLAALAAGAYFMLHGNKKNVNDAAKQSEKTVSSSAIDLSTINSVTLSLPSSISANFQANTSTTAGQYEYQTKDSTTSQPCTLSFGVYTATQMPGSDLSDIVNKGLAGLSGATITGPSAGTALVLKDASNSSTTYSLPTLQYEFSANSKQVKSLLSIAILKDGDRAAVIRECGNTNGAVSQSMLNEVEKAALDITVSKS